jgi:hypothetical protein
LVAGSHTPVQHSSLFTHVAPMPLHSINIGPSPPTGGKLPSPLVAVVPPSITLPPVVGAPAPASAPTPPPPSSSAAGSEDPHAHETHTAAATANTKLDVRRMKSS